MCIFGEQVLVFILCNAEAATANMNLCCVYMQKKDRQDRFSHTIHHHD